MKVYLCEQPSPEWASLRLGKLTASNVPAVFARLKDGKTEAAGRRNLRIQLVLERLTNQPAESGYVSADMERGTELEPDARAIYEASTAQLVEPVGFVEHDELLTGCSPDGFVGSDGLIEIKCPKAATHLDYLRSGLPGDYLKQITHQLWITGREWCDFVSYSPSFPDALKLKIQRVYRRDLDLETHIAAVRTFLSEVDRELAEVQALMAGVVAA